MRRWAVDLQSALIFVYRAVELSLSSRGISFHILAPRYFMEFKPYLEILTIGVRKSFFLEYEVL